MSHMKARFHQIFNYEIVDSATNPEAQHKNHWKLPDDPLRFHSASEGWFNPTTPPLINSISLL